ncbi:putative c6 zinc finger domain-containing protein [Neofusicoccum parvum UCRNP2]|uniref:Putative c6 zinc finger domain-containing protein n=1 Tax=Botryosphaeria parva (strain UCR-NP2) TaxID=1287680 RepID=R1G4I6_BOTPV|nr:putative c6 zinc finger domain-containing protein [Neofusicoccum parvum UCRNP2]
MSAADKIIMIHRPFLLPSFRNLAYARTRRTCVAAAKTILRHHERHAEEDRVSLWTHSAFAITAANVLGLELYHAATDDADADAIRDVLAKARERLSARKGDMLGKRSAELISAILEFDAERARTTRAGGDGGGWSEFFGQQQYVCGWFDFDAAAADVAGLDFVVGQEVPGLGDVVGGGSPLSLEEFEPWFTQAFGTVEAFL